MLVLASAESLVIMLVGRGDLLLERKKNQVETQMLLGINDKIKEPSGNPNVARNQ